MDTNFASRLMDIRRKCGFSVEDISSHLNVTRALVSKWERGLALPNDEELAKLAKLYGVSKADLCNLDKPIDLDKTIHVTTEEFTSIIKDFKVSYNKQKHYVDDMKNVVVFDPEGIIVGQSDSVINYDKLFVLGKEGQHIHAPDSEFFKKETFLSSKFKRLATFISPIILSLIIIIYFVCCFLEWQDWNKFWIIFLAYPLILSFLEAIFNKNAFMFAFPLLFLIIYLGIGVYASYWKYTALIFLLIPVVIVFENIFKKKIKVYFDDEEGIEHFFFLEKGDLIIEKANEI